MMLIVCSYAPSHAGFTFFTEFGHGKKSYSLYSKYMHQCQHVHHIKHMFWIGSFKPVGFLPFL
jgi:hypothetical protein